MSGGLAALLDDVAALVKLTAASIDDVGAAAGRASVKATGVVIDDTAVVPQYVDGITPQRELPIIKKIAMGSLRNKLVFILPIILLLSWLLPASLTPLLMLGGLYLSFEGAEKVIEMFSSHEDEQESAQKTPDSEKKIVSGAVRTDFILSSEIMVISYNSIATESSFWLRAAALVVVAILITLLVYGVVGLLVKMDDIGLALARKDSETSQKIGKGMVRAMPKVMNVISVIGTFAMLWVGGHILLVGLDSLGLHWPYSIAHHAEEFVHEHVHSWIGSALAWLAETFVAMVFGAIVGSIIAVMMHFIPKKKSKDHAPAQH
ncbi:MAG: DUF808 domain-containing protein [Rothia sp. (in: high G+C Gram-positive bacteria)]|nr:DUF808 domain-containing protein [Rothia sp. (in: high G+C Gram-positive bacteria)]